MSKSSGARNPFTREDDILLAKYIAVHNPARHGRSGNVLYKKLVANEDLRWSWSDRHPWQSWRDRYSKNMDWFDQLIARYQKKKDIAVVDRPPKPSETSKPPRVAGVTPEVGTQSDAKGKRKQQEDDEAKEKKRQKTIKVEERGSGSNMTQEEPRTGLGTPSNNATNDPLHVAVDGLSETSQANKPTRVADVKSRVGKKSDVKGKQKQEVAVEGEVKQEAKRRKITATGERRVGEVTTMQAVHRVELGTPLTNSTNDPLFTAVNSPPEPSQISKPSHVVGVKPEVGGKSDAKRKQQQQQEEEEEEDDVMVEIRVKQEGKRRKITTPSEERVGETTTVQEKPGTHPTNVTEGDDPLFTPITLPNGRMNEEAVDENEVTGQVMSVDEEKLAKDRRLQETGSRDEHLYPSLDKLPSPTLPSHPNPEQMPGSFVTGNSRPPKPKPRKSKSAAEDDPFVSSPASDSPADRQIPSHRVRKPPTLKKRPFGGIIHYSSPRPKEDGSDHDSDQQNDPHWPPIRAKASERVVSQGDPSRKTPELPNEAPVEEVPTGDSQRRRLSHREVQTDAEIAMPLASTSRVTLERQAEEVNCTTSHQATRRTTDALDLDVVEKRWLKSFDHRRRRMSAMSDFVRADELSTKNVQRLHNGESRRHSITGVATRSYSKESDLRINSLKRGAHSFTRSPPVISSPPFIPYKTLVPPSAVPNEEKDLINSLGVGAAIAHLAKMHGFGQEVAWNVWELAKSIHRTDAVLKAMRQSAEIEGLKLLEGVVDTDETNVSDVPESQPDDDDEDGGTSVKPDPDVHTITAESTPLRRRRKSLPFEYTPIRPGEELESDWQPPPSTRAAMVSRLFLQGRREEALEREQRRASVTSRSLTYTPDLRTSVTKTEPNDDIQMAEVSPELPSRTPAFKWTKKHDDVMLRAGFETETDVFKLESQVGDDRAMRQHFVRLLDILHPTRTTA